LEIVEKRKTGEILAAKVVSNYRDLPAKIYKFTNKSLWFVYVLTGESRENAAAHYVVLGEQADSQIARQNLCSIPSFCG